VRVANGPPLTRLTLRSGLQGYVSKGGHRQGSLP
jgi:hypothetical protein